MLQRFRMLRSISSWLAVAAGVALAGPALADGELDGMAAIVSGKAKLELEGDRLGRQELFAMMAFDAGFWGARDSEGNQLSGSYVSRGGSSKRHELALSPASEANLAAALTWLVGPDVVARYGPLPDGVLRIISVDGSTRVRGSFRSLKAKLSVRFVIESSFLPAPVDGRYKVSFRGALVGGRAAGGRVLVNGDRLRGNDIRRLSRRGLDVLPGSYWYDDRSGLWGLEGGPSLGQLPADLPLPSDLDSRASGGGTKVRLNGRILHPVELAYLESVFGRIRSGRYYLNPDGTGGRVGDPPSVDLRGGGGGGGGGRSLLGHSLTGSVIGGGGTVGFIDGGTGVTCGPDGGCIF